MGLDMYLKRFPRIPGLSGEQYEEVEGVVVATAFEKSEVNGVRHYRYIGITEAIDFAKELEFIKPEYNETLNEALQEQSIGNGSWVRFGEEAGYWRKANAIHQWFVKNVQKGVDDCGTYEVTASDLGRLNNIVQQILDDRNLAAKLLPPQSGFFFGSTEIDDWYWSDLEDTLEILTNAFETTNWETQVLMYHSSW